MATIESLSFSNTDLTWESLNSSGWAVFYSTPSTVITSTGFVVLVRLAVWVRKNSSGITISDCNFFEIYRVAIQAEYQGGQAYQLTATGGSSTSLSFKGMNTSSKSISINRKSSAIPSTSFVDWVYWDISKVYTAKAGFIANPIEFSVSSSSAITFTANNGSSGSVKGFSASFSFNTSRIQYKYRNGTGMYRQDRVPLYYNYTIRDPNEYSYTYNESQKYSIDFDTNGGESIGSRQATESYTAKKTFTNFIDDRGYTFAVYESWRARTDIILTQEYGSPEIISYSTSAKFGGLPNAWRIGYLPSNKWFNSENVEVSSSDLLRESPFTTVTEDGKPVRHVKIHPEYIAREYTVKYSLTSNEGKASLPDEGDDINSYTITKTFGTDIALPEVVPVLNGYLFTGWTDSKSKISPRDYRKGDTLSDQAYLWECGWHPNHTDHRAHTSVVILKPAWDLNPIKIKGYYYLTDNYPTPALIFDKEFNITTKTRGEDAFYLESPADRGGDYVFLGWVDTQPKDWTNPEAVNNGFCGTYAIPPDTILNVTTDPPIPMPIELPVKLSTRNRTDWGSEKGYYGIWAKTGKYIKISNTKWVKINKMYTKTEDNKWKVVKDVWVKVDNSNWKHEI